MNFQVLRCTIELLRDNSVEVEIFLRCKRSRHSVSLNSPPRREGWRDISSPSKARLHVFVQNSNELFDDHGTLQGGHEPAIRANRRFRRFSAAGQRSSHVRVLGFARTMAYTTHDTTLPI